MKNIRGAALGQNIQHSIFFFFFGTLVVAQPQKFSVVYYLDFESLETALAPGCVASVSWLINNSLLASNRTSFFRRCSLITYNNPLRWNCPFQFPSCMLEWHVNWQAGNALSHLILSQHLPQPGRCVSVCSDSSSPLFTAVKNHSALYWVWRREPSHYNSATYLSTFSSILSLPPWFSVCACAYLTTKFFPYQLWYFTLQFKNKNTLTNRKPVKLYENKI